GVHREWLSRLIKAPEKWPSLNDFIALCEALGIGLDYIVSGKGPRFINQADTVSIPIIQWASSNDIKEISRTSIPQSIIEGNILVQNIDKSDLIAFRVQDDAMDRIAPSQSIILVNRLDANLIDKKLYVFDAMDHTGPLFRRWGAFPPRLDSYSTHSH